MTKVRFGMKQREKAIMPKNVVMFFIEVGINEEDVFTDKADKDGFCHALECVASIKQAKRRAGELEQPASCAECGLVGVRRR